MTPILPALFAYYSTSIILVERNYNCLGIAAEQLKNDAYSKIIRVLQSADSSGIHIDPEDHRATLLRKHMHYFFLESGTSVLMIRDSKHSPKLVLPYKLCTRYRYQIQPMRALTTQVLLVCVNSYPATGGNSKTSTSRRMSIPVIREQNVREITAGVRASLLITVNEGRDNLSSSLYILQCPTPKASITSSPS